jgi:AbiV family abortive infection protein
MTSQNTSLTVYKHALANAGELIDEAEILFAAGRFARAYMLAFTSLEEISKSQLAADVFTGLIKEQDFWESYRDHKKKIGRMAWATEDAQRYLDAPDGVYVDVNEPKVANRMDALYVSVSREGGQVVSPSDLIGREEARGIIHTVNVALHQIYEMTEFWGHQIGTKGFMK